jgi:hypothetical protein
MDLTDIVYGDIEWIQVAFDDALWWKFMLVVLIATALQVIHLFIPHMCSRLLAGC